MRESKEERASVSMTSDASGGWGCMRGLLWVSVVQAAVGGYHQRLSYNSERAGANSDCSSNLGPELAGKDNTVLVRQCSSSEHHESGNITK